MSDPRILEKIAKCLALANDSRGDPTTAATALRQAQALMRQHGVTEDGLAASTCDHQTLRSAFSVSQPKSYETRLMRAVADAFGCEILWTASRSTAANVFGIFSIIGPKARTAIAQHTAIVLQRQLVRARADFVRSLPGYVRGHQKTVEADGFSVGWVAAVIKTVDAFADPDGSTAKARKLYIEATWKSVGSAKTQQRTIGSMGFAAGEAEGAKVSLRRPVQSGAEAALAIGG